MFTLPSNRTGVMRYAASAFMIFWLGGWAVGWVAAFRQIITGAKGAEPFLIFWLGAWTVCGGFAMWWLWSMLRPPVPETVVFAPPDLIYDTGIQPFQMSFDYRAQMDFWKKMFEKRKRYTFTSADIKTLRLRDTDGGNRLTIDQGIVRVDVGRGLTEVEREWLFQQINEKYKL